MSTTSQIQINVTLDEQRIPESITWQASDSNHAAPQKAKAMIVSFWDGEEKTALRIDLWTKNMMVDEMANFFYQTFLSMAATYQNATQQQELSDHIKNFATEFYNQFRQLQLQQQKS